MNTHRRFLDVEGRCKECGYPVILDSGKIDEIPNDYGDYHIYCSNPSCKNHIGVVIGDMELDEEHAPFVNFYDLERRNKITVLMKGSVWSCCDEYDWEDDEHWGEDYYGEEDNV